MTANEAPALFSDEREGTDPDGTPVGLLMWGQPGVFNAVDDRMALTAMADAAVGVVRSTVITAGTGLTISVAPGWLVIASCDDGTCAVAGARQTHELQAPAGVVGQETWYHLWVDTDPAEAKWSLRIVSQDDTVGRAGVSLGRITVPAGANLASQMTFSRLVPTVGPHAICPPVASAESGVVSSGSPTRITPDYAIAPYQMVGNRAFKLWAYGGGQVGVSRTLLQFQGAGGVDAQPIQSVDMGGLGGDWLFPRDVFSWEAELCYHVRADRGGMRSSFRVTISREMGNRQAGYGRTFTHYESAHAYSDLWQSMHIKAGWSSGVSGQQVHCAGSTFGSFDPYNL